MFRKDIENLYTDTIKEWYNNSYRKHFLISLFLIVSPNWWNLFFTENYHFEKWN